MQQGTLSIERPSRRRAPISSTVAQQHERFGDRWLTVVRDGVIEMARACRHTPAPRSWIVDLSEERARIKSPEKVFRAVSLVLSDRTLPDAAIEVFMQKQHDLMMSDRAKPVSFVDAWRAENQAQAAADIALADALIAIERNDVPTMKRAQVEVLHHRMRLDNIAHTLGARILLAERRA